MYIYIYTYINLAKEISFEGLQDLAFFQPFCESVPLQVAKRDMNYEVLCIAAGRPRPSTLWLCQHSERENDHRNRGFSH